MLAHIGIGIPLAVPAVEGMTTAMVSTPSGLISIRESNAEVGRMAAQSERSRTQPHSYSVLHRPLRVLVLAWHESNFCQALRRAMILGAKK
jgi:hypothetical protein